MENTDVPAELVGVEGLTIVHPVGQSESVLSQYPGELVEVESGYSKFLPSDRDWETS